MVMFTTRIPRKNTSRQSPNARVSTANAARIRLNTVRTFARTMLAYERPGARGRCMRVRAAASASVSPSGPVVTGGTAVSAVSVLTP